jgi:hypothetical protein
MRRFGRFATALAVLGLFVGGCSSSAGQSGGTYPSYTFSCCQATGARGWYPGATVSLNWIVQQVGDTADNGRVALTLTASLIGPYPDVNSLKAGVPAAKTLQVPPVSTDNRTPTAPTSSLTLPPDFAPGFYNLAFTTDSGNGNSWGGASVIDVGASGAAADPMAVLNRRPLQQPVLASGASCPASPMVNLLGVAPDYGFGEWPAFISGQTSWYAGGQGAMLMVGSSYSGPLLVRGFQLDGNGRSNVTLAEEDLPPASAGDFAAKEKQHSVELVSGIHTTEGGLELQSSPPSSLWRAWSGRLSTGGPGCFALQVDGDTFTRTIVISVAAGPPPPG